MPKGNGHIYLRGRLWWIKFYDQGRPVYESSKSAKRGVAETLLKKRQGEVASGMYNSPDLIEVNTLLADLLAYCKIRYSSFDSFARPKIESRLMKYWKGWKACRVTTEALENYQKRCLAKGDSNATVNRDLALLRRAFKLGYQCTPRKVTNIPYFPMLPENNVRKGFLEHTQYRRLLDELPAELKPLLVVGFHLGCRKQELLRMRVEQVDLDAGEMTLYPGETKNKEGRTLPIYGDMLPMLKAQLEGIRRDYPRCHWVFHRDGERIRSFKGSWAVACERAGLKGLLFHDLRRSAVRNMRRAGIPESIAMRISGHKTRSMFERYNIVNAEDLKDAGKKLTEYLGRGRKGKK